MENPLSTMDTSVKTEEAQDSSLPRDGDNKLKLFEKIVYFASGSIGNEVSTALYVHGIVNCGVLAFVGIIGAQKQQCRIDMFTV